MRPGALWESFGVEAVQIAFIENAFRPGQASGGRNVRDGFERDRLAAILCQASPGDDDPERRGGGIDLRSHYRESQTIPLNQSNSHPATRACLAFAGEKQSCTGMFKRTNYSLLNAVKYSHAILPRKTS